LQDTPVRQLTLGERRHYLHSRPGLLQQSAQGTPAVLEQVALLG